MDNVSKYYVAKRVEIRHSIDSEWPALLKQALKHPHIHTFPDPIHHSTTGSNILALECGSDHQIAHLDNLSANYLVADGCSQYPNNIAAERTEFVGKDMDSSHALELPDSMPTPTAFNEQMMEILVVSARKAMTSYVTSSYTLGSSKKNLSASSDYEGLTALKDALNQLIYSRGTELEVILITSDFSGLLKSNEAIVTKCTNNFRTELNKMDIKITTFYDLAEKEYKRTDLYRLQRDYSYLDSKKTLLNTLDLPNSPMYTINTLYFKGSNATNFYSIILNRVKLSLENDTVNSSYFRVNYLITNFPLLYGKLCNNKISFDNSIYFDGKLSTNFKRTIVQGHLTPGKLQFLCSILMELENMKAFKMHEILVSYDAGLLNDMHEKTLHIESNRIFKSYAKHQSKLAKNYPWLYKYLRDLVPQTRFTLNNIDTPTLSVGNELIPLSNGPEIEVCHFYTHPKLEPLVNQLVHRAETNTFKIKIISQNTCDYTHTNLHICNMATMNLYNKWALDEPLIDLPKLSANEYISKLWLLHILNHKRQLRKLLFQQHPLRQVATFTYLVKNIRINQLYRFCVEYDKLDINTTCTYSHVDWSQVNFNNTDDFYHLVTQQYTKVSMESADNITTIVIICVGGSEDTIEEWENFNITKMVFDFDSVMINPHQWDIGKQLNNPLSIDHIFTKLEQLDELNISSFRHLLNLSHSRCYDIIHSTQLDVNNLSGDIGKSDNVLFENMKNSRIVPLCLSNNMLSDAERIKDLLVAKGLTVAEPVNMGWIYDCYHYGLVDYGNSLELHRGIVDHKFSFWGWTFFVINDALSKLPRIEMRKSWGIDLVTVGPAENLSQVISKHFTERITQFELSESHLQYLGSDIIYTRYLIVKGDANDDRIGHDVNYFTVKISEKQLVTLGYSSCFGIKICVERETESLLDYMGEI